MKSPGPNHLFKDINRQFTSVLIIVLMSFAITPGVQAQLPRYFADPVADPFDLGYQTVPGEVIYRPSVVDIDNDGDLDLFVLKGRVFIATIQREALLYHENIGDQDSTVYAPADSVAFGIPDSITGRLVFVDIDNDQDLDLFTTVYWSWNTDDILFLENTGNENLAEFGDTEPVVNPFNLDPEEGSLYDWISFGDMDADGDLDAFMNGHMTDRLLYQENVGSKREPQFGLPHLNPWGFSLGEYDATFLSVQPHDWDCDGDPDLMMFRLVDTTLPHVYLALFENQGTPAQPNFVEGGIHRLDDELIPWTYVDYNGDGNLDVFAMDGYYENVRGCGKFFQEMDESVLGLDLFPRPEGDFYDPTLVDMDGDGDKDLFVSTATDLSWHDLVGVYGYAKQLDYYENVGTTAESAFVWKDTMPFGIPRTLIDSFGIVSFEFVDLDDDGDPDLLGGYNFPRLVDSRGLVYLENRGTPLAPDFSNSEIVKNPFGLDVWRAFTHLIHPGSFADIDGDGDLDRLGREFLFQRNIGTANNPLFDETEEIDVTFEFWDFSGGKDNCMFFDVDCDGDYDIVGHTWIPPAPTRKVFVIHNNGTVTEPVFDMYKLYENHFIIGALSDLNSDGYLDAMKADALGDMDDPVEAFYHISVLQPGNCVTSGIREFFSPVQAKSLNIYPNPADGIVRVGLANSIHPFAGSLEVVDYCGKMVRSIEAVVLQPHETVQLDISNLSSGLYVIRLVAAGEVHVGQFVVVQN